MRSKNATVGHGKFTLTSSHVINTSKPELWGFRRNRIPYREKSKMIAWDPIHFSWNAAKGCVESGRCCVEQTGMTDPTLAAFKRPFVAMANWAEHLYACLKIKFPTKKFELQVENYLHWD